jgi:hypothetical protein
MNDFIGHPNALRGEVLTSFISHRHGSLYTPTKAKGLRQQDGNLSPLKSIVVVCEFLESGYFDILTVAEWQLRLRDQIPCDGNFLNYGAIA